MKQLGKVTFLLWYGMGDEIALFVLVLIVAPVWCLVRYYYEQARQRA